MFSYPRAILYAIVLWTVTFLLTFFIYPLRTESIMLFATLRTVAMVLTSVILTVMYYRDVEEHLVRDGVRLGAIWLVVSLVLDQGPFVWGLLHLSLLDYLADTGLSHLIYPIITIGAGLLLSADKSTVEDSESSGPQARPWTPEEPLSHRPSEPKERV
jgi:EamA domain-containing membrane protein RarD